MLTDQAYLHDNRHIAERLMIFIEGRRLLRDRMTDEDQVYCRKSAQELRRILENEMLTVKGGGVLLDAIRDLRKACANFVSAAGPKSKAFKEDDVLFRYHLELLRETFAQRVTLVVDVFDLQPSTELEEIMQCARGKPHQGA